MTIIKSNSVDLDQTAPDQGLHYFIKLPFRRHFWTQYSIVKPKDGN